MASQGSPDTSRRWTSSSHWRWPCPAPISFPVTTWMPLEINFFLLWHRGICMHFFALPLFNRKPLVTLPLHSFTYLNPSSSTGIIPRQYDIRSQGKWKDKLSQRIASNNLWDKIMWLCMQLYIYLNQPFLLYWQWNGPTVKQHYFSFMCLSFLWFSNWPRQVSIIAQLVDGFSCRSHCDQV